MLFNDNEAYIYIYIVCVCVCVCVFGEMTLSSVLENFPYGEEQYQDFES